MKWLLRPLWRPIPFVSLVRNQEVKALGLPALLTLAAMVGLGSGPAMVSIGAKLQNGFSADLFAIFTCLNIFSIAVMLQSSGALLGDLLGEEWDPGETAFMAKKKRFILDIARALAVLPFVSTGAALFIHFHRVPV